MVPTKGKSGVAAAAAVVVTPSAEIKNELSDDEKSKQQQQQPKKRLKLEHNEDDSNLQEVKQESKLNNHNLYDPLKPIKQEPLSEDEEEVEHQLQQIVAMQDPPSEEEEELQELSPANLKYVNRIKIMGGTYAILWRCFYPPRAS